MLQHLFLDVKPKGEGEAKTQDVGENGATRS
jgi:hypothetical protein